MSIVVKTAVYASLVRRAGEAGAGDRRAEPTGLRRQDDGGGRRHSVSSRRFPMLLLSRLRVLALVLAAVGIAGVVATRSCSGHRRSASADGARGQRVDVLRLCPRSVSDLDSRRRRLRAGGGFRPAAIPGHAAVRNQAGRSGGAGCGVRPSRCRLDHGELSAARRAMGIDAVRALREG